MYCILCVNLCVLVAADRHGMGVNVLYFVCIVLQQLIDMGVNVLYFVCVNLCVLVADMGWV